MARSVFHTAVERPILAASLNLLLIALGLGAILALPVREYPDIDPPTVSVRTQYVGAPAEVVEREVTKIIEDNLSGIDGVRQIQSTSRNEASSINIEFTAGTNIDGAAADVRDRVSSVRSDLPDDVEEPVIEKANADDQPMMWITLRSDDLAPPELTDIAERLITDTLGVVPGVSRIQIGGEKRFAMRIWLDRRAMAARGVTPGDVAARLRAENVEVPAGRLETGQQELTLRAETRFSDAGEFAALVLRSDGADRVTLGDVARVEVGVEDYRSALRANGREAISLGIIRQSNANTLSVANGVERELDRIRRSIPRSITLSIDYDESVFIRETLKNVATTLALVIAIVVAVIWLFLGSLRATLIPAAAIPASIVPAFLVAAAFGFSINTLTILAVVLAISLCTDDAVVIIENIRRWQQDGRPVLAAAAGATRQVGFAALSTSAVLVAATVPLAFIAGNVGRLFQEFAIVLAAIVVFSTFAALSLSPMLASILFAKEEKRTRLAASVDRGLGKLGHVYGNTLDKAAAKPLLPILAALLAVGLGVAAFLTLPSELAPEEDRGALRIRVEGPEGTGYDYTDARVREIEQMLAGYRETPEDARRRDAGEDVPEKPVQSLLAIVAPGFGGAANTNSAFLIVRLRDWGDRDLSQSDVQQRLQRDLAQVTGARAFATGSASLGQRRRGQQLQYVIGGTDREQVRHWAETMLAEAEGIEGLQNADIDYKDTRPQVTLTLDRARAAALGVDAASVGEALQIMFGSLQLTRYVDRGEEYDVILQGADETRRSIDDLRNVFVRADAAAAGGGAVPPGRGGPIPVTPSPARSTAATPRLVPLSSVVTIEERGTVRELGRIDRRAAITLEASLAPGLSLGEALDRLDRIAEEKLPADAQISYSGEALDLQETGGSLYLLLILVLVLAYLVLAGQFESFLHPLIILAAVPLAIAGGLITMWALGFTLNIYTQIGLILLIGLVAKNGILLVEFANQLRGEGREARDAAIEAARLRLRPILMTSVATILGAVPLLLESGAGAEARRTLGAVTAGGLTIGTALTLFLVPTLYVLLGRFTSAPDARADALRRQEEDGEAEGGAAPQPAE